MVVKVVDSLGRNINYMRISITDRCNLRCKYCMPDGIDYVSMKEILSYEEIVAIVKEAVKLGISKIKITGGEPLVRRECYKLVKMIKEVEGIDEVTLTTNGVLLAQQLPSLIEAGIDGINVSLDTLDRNRFKEITGMDSFDEVCCGIDAAINAGIKTKINVVSLKYKKEILTEDFIRLIELTRKKNLDVRFIEMMPIGSGKGFDLASNDLLIREILSVYPQMTLDNTEHGNGPAVYYKIPGFKGSLGFISAMHGKFCTSCNRVRLSSRGYMKACLCYDSGKELMPILRGDSFNSSKKLREAMAEVIYNKPEAHCFERIMDITEDKYMASIGG